MENKPQQDLNHIREMMQRSTRFMSLSGLSGIAAGVVALLSSFFVYITLKNNGIDYFDTHYFDLSASLFVRLLCLALVTALLACVGALYFTLRKGKAMRQNLWTAQTRRMLFQLVLPLKVGALVCLALSYHHLFVLVAPVTLVFYGLALVAAAKYTYGDILYLGVLELCLGVLGLFFLGYGLLLWAVGFGVMHIVYGVLMYIKYDKGVKA